MENPQSISEFWFGSDPDDAVTAQQQSRLWWSKNTEIDQQIRMRFASTVEAAGARGMESWKTSPAGLLALVLLTDQFPRNMYRDTGQAFAFDPLAREYCLFGLDRGTDQALRPIERVFFYLPLEHSESSEHQALSVQLFTQLYQDVRTEHMDVFRGFLMYALRHRRIIERFGRFPHRNKALGRASTPDEIIFLQEPGSAF